MTPGMASRRCSAAWPCAPLRTRDCPAPWISTAGPAVAQQRHELLDLTRRVVERAQVQGRLRRDLTWQDVLRLTGAQRYRDASWDSSPTLQTVTTWC